MIGKNIYILTFIIPSMVILVCVNYFLFCEKLYCSTSILSVINKYVLLIWMIISLLLYGLYLHQSYIRNKIFSELSSKFKILLAKTLSQLFLCFPFALSSGLALSHVFHYSLVKLYIIVLFILWLIAIFGTISFSIERASQYFFVDHDKSIYVPIFQNPQDEPKQENKSKQKESEVVLNPYNELNPRRLDVQDRSKSDDSASEVLRPPNSDNVEASDNINLKSWEANISWSSYFIFLIGLIGYTYLVFKAVADFQIKIIIYILIAYMFVISSFFFVLSAKNSNFWSSGTEAWQKSLAQERIDINNFLKWNDLKLVDNEQRTEQIKNMRKRLVLQAQNMLNQKILHNLSKISYRQEDWHKLLWATIEQKFVLRFVDEKVISEEWRAFYEIIMESNMKLYICRMPPEAIMFMEAWGQFCGEKFDDEMKKPYQKWLNKQIISCQYRGWITPSDVQEAWTEFLDINGLRDQWNAALSKRESEENIESL